MLLRGEPPATMSEDTSREIVVSGPTHVESVDAARFEASGATTVDGDLRADTVDVSGATSVGGDLRGDDLEASGSLDVGGAVTVEAADFSGATEIGSDLTAIHLEASGATEVGGRVSVERLDVGGALESEAIDAEAIDTRGALETRTLTVKQFEGSGAVEADSVEAGTFELRVEHGDSTIGTLETDHVTVEAGGSRDGLVGAALDALRGDGRLEVDEITAETADLERTRVGTLRAEEATLGPDVTVGDLYVDEWEAAEEATVERVHETSAEEA